MSANRWHVWAVFLTLAVVVGFAQDRKEAERRGTVSGLATLKAGYWIEVKADGEEKARRYYCGSDPKALKAVKDTEVGSRVRLEWRFNEVFRVVKIDVLKAPVKNPG